MNPHAKLLVLDLDETLVHATETPLAGDAYAAQIVDRVFTGHPLAAYLKQLAAVPNVRTVEKRH